MTGDNQDRCEACGHVLGGPSEEQGMAPPPNPYRDEPRTRLEMNLRRHVEVMDRIAGQVDELLSLVRSGDATIQQALDSLEGLRQDLKPATGYASIPSAPCAGSTRKRSRSMFCYTWTGRCPALSPPWSRPATGTKGAVLPAPARS